MNINYYALGKLCMHNCIQFCDIQTCTNDHWIKLMSHTMRFWERVIEQILQNKICVSENQFYFMPGGLTMKSYYLVFFTRKEETCI